MKATRFSLPAMLLLASGSGLATTIVQTQGATLIDVGNSFSVPVEFTPFDSALGSLTAVTLALQASFSGTVGVENLSDVPDVATGIIAGSVIVETNNGSLSAEVFPSADGPTLNLAAFDGSIDFSGPSGATDPASGPAAGASASGSTPQVLSLFSGPGQIFLTLTASTFPIVEGRETEAVEETASATANVVLTYDYAAAPEPGTVALLAAGLVVLLWAGRRRGHGPIRNGALRWDPPRRRGAPAPNRPAMRRPRRATRRRRR